LKKNEFLSALDELLELEDGTLKGSESLDSLESWDSLAIISFIALADERCGVSLKPRQISDCSTIEDLAGLLGDRITVEVLA